MSTKNTRKVSLFYLILIMVALCVTVVVYVSNSIEIKKLAVNNNLLKEEIKRQVQDNDMLINEVEKLSSFDRISDLAGRKFALKYKESSITDKKVVLKKSEMP